MLLTVVPPTLILWLGVFGILDESLASTASLLRAASPGRADR